MMFAFLSNKKVSSLTLQIIRFLLVSFICSIIGIILFSNKNRVNEIVHVLDKLKTQSRYSISLPSFLFFNIIAIILCFPLSPHQVLSGYCLGAGIGAIINVIGTVIGIGICFMLNNLVKKIHIIASKLHPNFCQWAEQEGFFYIFLNVFSPKLTIGMSVYLISKNHYISYLIAIVTASIILSAFYSYSGSLIDPFAIFIIEGVQLIVILLISIISFSGTLYWSHGLSTKNKKFFSSNSIIEERRNVLTKKQFSCLGLLKQIFTVSEEFEFPDNVSDVSSVECETRQE
ncbi:SNARE associated Golgi protein [Entamoeba histolytica HM-3:IMSS]|uniref:SNARE associated Golgi protein n=1 Tax=Entamoeba histolytica HM-3:IMSS TaxID=885315 RepID=M7WEW3_ENTHI|nr:SNARE associated Golgi protein [Entamoeba histolytica HM-3:IMSS]